MTKLLQKWRPHILPEDERPQPPVKEEAQPTTQTTNGTASQENPMLAQSATGTEQAQQHTTSRSTAPANNDIPAGQGQERAMDVTPSAPPEGSVPAS